MQSSAQYVRYILYLLSTMPQLGLESSSTGIIKRKHFAVEHDTIKYVRVRIT